MDRKLIWVGVGILSIIALATAVTFLLAKPPEFNGTVYEPKAAPGIELSTSSGQMFKLSDQRGKVVLLFFGYTNCPDVCPTTMANLREALSQLGDEAEKVQVVFITVDPNRDTPEAAQRYVSSFDSAFIGLSGTEAELASIWSKYGVYRELGQKDADGNYPVTHTARVTVIDGHGDLRLSINYDVPWQEILADLQLLIAED
jgi:protein SCO1/2